MASQRRPKLDLPRSLREQIGFSSVRKPKSNRRPPVAHSRKDQRKHERLQNKSSRKQNLALHHSRREVLKSESSDEQDRLQPSSDPQTIDGDAGFPNRATAPILKNKTSTKNATSKKDARSKGNDTAETVKLSKRAFEDDAEIVALETKLGIRGKTKLPKAFEEDGLDVLLHGLEHSSDSGPESGTKRERSQDRQWLKRKRRKLDNVQEVSEKDLEEPDLLFADEDSVSDHHGISDDEFDVLSRETYDLGSSTDDDAGGHPTADNMLPVPNGRTRVRENPYIAPTVADPHTSAKYIPPSQRPSTSDIGEATVRLKRQIVGLLNRLSDANALSLLGDLEKLYQSHPRQEVTLLLTERLVDLMSDKSSLNDTFIILHAGFIAAVYKIIGPDFGAQLIEAIVMKLGQCLADRNGNHEDGKSAINLVSCLDRLYVFQVINCALIFDYIRVFLQDLSEMSAELLLRIIKDVGSQLRHDDPSSLKDIVVMLQNSVALIGEANLSIRTKFMIETINDLKNNRMRTGIAAGAVISEHTNRMKKMLGSLNTRTIRSSEPLRFSLRDIQDTDKKGKWWLVEASWKGDADQKNSRLSNNFTEKEDDSLAADEDTADLLQIAREQRMNTDIRRAIFLSIMSASDYKDAHLRLSKLRLKKSQEVEVPRVLLHCARVENRYNPYYTLIARKLCSQHKLKMAFRFALWDLFKQMGEDGEFDDSAEANEDDDDALSDANIVNLAKLYGTLICEGLINLDVLKAVDLIYLRPKTKIFVEVMLVTVFVKCKDGKKHDFNLKKVFGGTKDIAGLAKGLQYFLRKVVSKSDLVNGKSERVALKVGLRKAEDALTDSPESIEVI